MKVTMESILITLALVFVATLVILYVWSIIWGYRDATKRGKNGFAVASFVAIFAWPFGLLFWTTIRPEKIKSKTKTRANLVKKNGYSFNQKKYVSDFKAMPLMIKVLLIVTLIALFETLVNILQMKQVSFEYFNSGFPKNYPFIWYLYLLLFNVFGIIVYFKRSYSLLKKYLYISLGILIIAAINGALQILYLPAEQRLFALVIYAVTLVIGGLVLFYLFNQKKYFNET